MTSRAATFASLLDDDSPEHHLVLAQFRQLCGQGIPDEPARVRAQSWRPLTGILGQDRRQWRHELEQKRASYYGLAHDILARVENDELTPPHKLKEQDTRITEILNDVQRTQAAVSFFATTVEPPSFPSRRALLNRIDALRGRAAHPTASNGRSSVASTSSFHSIASSSASYRYASPMTTATSIPEEAEAMWEGLLRMLFVWSSLNAHPGYVQGLAEIAAPLLYAFGQDDATTAEADAFYALSALVDAGLGDLLSPDHDRDPTRPGLGLAIATLAEQIDEQDQALGQHLRAVDVRPSFYAVQWLLTAFAQPLPLPETLRLFDSLLAELASPTLGDIPPSVQLLIDIATAIVISQRNDLVNRSFPLCMRVLQAAPATLNIDDLLLSAFLARQQRQAAAFASDAVAPTRLAAAKRTLAASQTSASTWLAKTATSIAESDATARASKAATNLRATAPTRFEQLRANVAARAAGAKATASAIVRPASPEADPPFRPPGQGSPSPEHASPRARTYQAPDYLISTPSPAPAKQKPLLLSPAARRANPSEDSTDDEPPRSRRSSWIGSGPMPYANGSRPASPVAMRSTASQEGARQAIEDLTITSTRLPPRSPRRGKQASSDGPEDPPFVPPVRHEDPPLTTHEDPPFVPPMVYGRPPSPPLGRPPATPTLAYLDESAPFLTSVPPRRTSYQPPRSPSPPHRPSRDTLDAAFDPTPQPSPSRTRGVTLVDAPASRLAQSHPLPSRRSYVDAAPPLQSPPLDARTPAPPSARPPRGTSLVTSPTSPPAAASPLRRSKILASARKRLSGSSVASRASLEEANARQSLHSEGEVIGDEELLSLYR